MRPKILITGKSAQVSDFLRHANEYFNILSTSKQIIDINNHFKAFEPDAFVAFLDADDNESFTSINSMRDYPTYNSAPVIVVGNDDTHDLLNRRYPHFFDLFIKRPISVDNLALKVTRYLEELREKKENEAIEAAAKEAEPNAKKHILVVDDDRNVLKILKAALSDTYDVTTMANGVLVEKFLDSKDVNMIILDHEMPIETGSEVFRKLKNHPKGKNIPVCFLTGVSERSVIEEIMKLRPHGYLLKPINIEMLMATISNLID